MTVHVESFREHILDAFLRGESRGNHPKYLISSSVIPPPMAAKDEGKRHADFQDGLFLHNAASDPCSGIPCGVSHVIIRLLVDHQRRAFGVEQ